MKNETALQLNPQRSALLLVEGEDDKRFFESLMRYMTLNNTQVLKMGGKDNLGNRLKAIKNDPYFPALERCGIVRDADEDADAAFESVRTALEQASLSLPTKPLVFAGSQPAVGVLIMPPSKNAGTLEDLLLEAVNSDPAILCIDELFQCLKAKDPMTLSSHRMPKAKIYTFLATRSEPGKRIGEAAEAGYWPFNGAVFEPIKAFIKELNG